MPSIKDLKKRIGSVKNTQQTTKAMKMVSASKLRRAQDAIQSHRPYAHRVGALIQKLTTLVDEKIVLAPQVQKLFEPREVDSTKKPRVLLLVCTSDRGLCGGFNSNVIKATQRWLVANQDKYESIQCSFLGRRGHDFFKNKKINVSKYFADLGGKVTFLKAKALSEALLDEYLNDRVDEVKVIYNEFKNAVTQKVQVENFLPLNADAQPVAASADGAVPMYIVKPSVPEMIDSLLMKNFSIQAYRIMLESQASEHGARMAAMENATRNAGEMIRKLTLQYNKQRQAGITKELLEIISGSESQKSA